MTKIRLIVLVLSFMAFCQVAAQDDLFPEAVEVTSADIAQELAKKYEEVEYSYNSKVFCVKKNGKWEFADEKGKILTKMNISEASGEYDCVNFTINNIQYKAEYPFESGKLLVSRYNRYAYMNRQGKLLTSFIYDSSGDVIYDEVESGELIMVNDFVEAFLQNHPVDEDNVDPSTFNEFITILNISNAQLLTDDNAEAVTAFIYHYTENNLSDVDKPSIDKLCELIYGMKNSTSKTLKAITGYRINSTTEEREKFRLIQDLNKRVEDSETYTYLGLMLHAGKGCQQDVQRGINCFEKAINDGFFDDEYKAMARQSLRQIWLSDSTRYKNPYGRMLTKYDLVRKYSEYIIVRKGDLIGCCDTLFNEILPCRYKDIEAYHPLYAVETDNGWQLVTIGGKELIVDFYQSIRILKYSDNSYMIFVQRDNKWGVVDEHGNVVTAMVFDDVTIPLVFFGNVYPTIKIDDDEYKLCRPFKGGRVIVEQYNLYGIMDTNGNIVVPCQYKEINDFEEGDTTTLATTYEDRIVTIKIK